MTQDLIQNDLSDLYQDLILDHGKNPRNFRALKNACCEALGHNPLCGDKLVLYLDVGEDGKISDVAFQGSGCAISVASASMMTEILKGKTAAEAHRLFDYFHAICTGDPADAMGLNADDLDRLQALAGVRRYPMRVKCATLAWQTLKAALTPNETKATSTECSCGVEHDEKR